MTDTTSNTSQATETESPAPVEVETGNTEAKKYRLKLREVEAERDALRTSLGAARTGMVRELLSTRSFDNGKTQFNMAAFDDAGLDIGDLFNEAGDLDHEKVSNVMNELKASKPYMFSEIRNTVIRAGAEHDDLYKALGFEQAFTAPNM